MTAPVAPRANPYVGPRSFRAGERLYARDREIETLYSLLIAERIVLMYSPSGAGKSSLLQAGLIPRLEAERFVVRPPIRVGTEPPSGSPPGVNRFMLSALLSVGDDTDDDSPESLAALVRVPLAQHLGERRARERAREQALAREREAAGDEDDDDDDAPGTTRGEVLIFDQFEEILTVEPSELAVKQAFFRELGEALRDDGRWAVFAMREDFIAGLDPFRASIPHRLRATFRLDLLRTDAAVTAIQSPARAAGVELTDEAARQLAEDLAQIKVQRVDGGVDVRSGPYVEPVQLQVVCHRMWERLPADARVIGLPEVRALGAVDDALALYFDVQVAAAAAACAVPERSLRAWLGRHLVTPQGMRTQVLQTPDTTLELANAVLWRLVDGHTLRSDSRRGMIWFELAHDRLVKPMQRSNERWARVHTTAIQQQAALWHAQGRPERLLLPGTSDFDQVARDVGECTPTEREFLEQSRASAARHRKLRRSQRLIVALGAAVLLLVVVALVVGFVVYDKYQTKKHALAEARGALAEQAAGDHEREARGSLTRQLGAQAQLYTQQRPEVAALLGVAAAHYADGWPRTGALLATVAGAPQRVGQFTLPAGARALVRDAHGRLVALDGRGGLHLREVDGVRALATALEQVGAAAGPAGTEGAGRGATGTAATPRMVSAVVAHPGRAELVLGDATGRLSVWDIAADREVRALVGVIEAGRDDLRLAIDATGTRLAALTWTLDAGQSGELAIVELASGEVVSRRRLARVSPGALALAPDGRLAATSEPDAVVLHQVDGGAAQRVPLAARATRLRFSADGARLLALDGIGGAWVWTIADGALVGPQRPAGVGAAVLDVAFAPDGQLAALTGPPGRRALSLWRGDPARPEGVPIAVGDDVRSVQFVGPDSDQLAAISPEGDVTLYDPALDRPTRVGGPDGGVVVMAAHEDAAGTTTVAAASYENAARSGALHIWRLAADGLQEVDTLPGISAPPRQLLFNSSGRTLTVLTDAHAQTWDLAARTSASEPLPGSGERLLVGAHHGGVRVATVVDGEVVVADAGEGWRPRRIEDSHGATQIALAGEVLAIARCTDRTFTDVCVTSELRVVDAASGRVLRVEADPHAARVVALALSPKGEQLASAAADGSLINLKILAGSRHSLSPRRPLHFTEGLTFSADGKIVAEVSAAPDAGLGAASEIQLWDIEGGDALAPAWRGHDPRVRSEVAARRSLLFTSTGHLLSSSHDGITVWILKDETLRRRACTSAGRELTYEEWLRFVGAERGYREVCVGVLGGYPLRGQALGFIPPRFGRWLVTRTPIAALPYLATFPPFAE